jgi:hypothetical protein
MFLRRTSRRRDDGAWIISPSSIQQAFADEHVDFSFA